MRWAEAGASKCVVAAGEVERLGQTIWKRQDASRQLLDVKREYERMARRVENSDQFVSNQRESRSPQARIQYVDNGVRDTGPSATCSYKLILRSSPAASCLDFSSLASTKVRAQSFTNGAPFRRLHRTDAHLGL